MKEINSEFIDECIERHKETTAILSRPDRVKIIEQGKTEVAKGIK